MKHHQTFSCVQWQRSGMRLTSRHVNMNNKESKYLLEISSCAYGTACVVCSEFYRWKIWEFLCVFRRSASIQLSSSRLKNYFLGEISNPTVRCNRLRKWERNRRTVLKGEKIACCNFGLRAGICEPSHGKSCEVGSAVPHQLFFPCLCSRKTRTDFVQRPAK